MNPSPHLVGKLAGLPERPGVYMMRDVERHVIYVGKAVVLRNRVRSYFHDSAGHSGKTERLVAEVADVEWIVTESELEALILECELIKRYHPRYNVRLRDDKRYPYIKVSLNEEYPRVYIVRNMARDGARYFGPFASSQAVYQSLDLLQRLFPYRTCEREITGKDSRPCLYYHIKRCPGPCIGAVDAPTYRRTMEQACLFLEGKQDQIIQAMQEEMRAAAEDLRFERAAALRNQIGAITQIIERQRIVTGHLHDHDFVAFARDNGQACVQVFFVRGGRLIGREYYMLTGTQGEDDSSVMASFIKQFYDEAAQIPPEILVQTDLDELAIIEQWLHARRGTRVAVKVPRRGEKRGVMNMALENAVVTLNRLRAEWEADTNKHTEALAELQAALGLLEPPTRIECYDISNTQGTHTTASMVVFAKGVPSKSDYRRFRIRTVEGSNDFASLQEALSRRFARAAGATAISDEAVSAGTSLEVQGANPRGDRWAVLPDLVVVDGGAGQLSAAREVMQSLGVGHIATIGLAKREEEVYVPDRPAPILLSRDSQALYLLQRIRDEAHRFAITYHRQLRGKASQASILDEVPGIGPKRRKELLKRFGSVEAMRQASVEDLASVAGMTRQAAEQLAQYL